jgi:hypothetical protein
MKTALAQIMVLILGVGQSFLTYSIPSRLREPLHLDPSSSGIDYRAYFKNQKSYQDHLALGENILKGQFKSAALLDEEDFNLAKWIAVGEKTLKWVDLINSKRSKENKISLSSRATQAGNPVGNPRLYSYRIIKERWDILNKLLPSELGQVLFGSDDVTDTNPVTDREFTEWLLQVDSTYQITVRYFSNRKWKDYFLERARFDVRGYLSLLVRENLDELLEKISAQPRLLKQRLLSDLALICMNSREDFKGCDKELEDSLAENQLVKFKDKYFYGAALNYDSFFAIPVKRPDVIWTSGNPLEMSIPVTRPESLEIEQFLKFNVEDEFNYNQWKLKLNYVSEVSEDITHVVFEPGVTPYVNGLGGSKITMDKNAPLSEYDVQWTIRHEFGHVLGIPDCYFEFYDESIEAFVSYQLDVTNLMCSRRGSFQDLHYEELKRVYFSN